MCFFTEYLFLVDWSLQIWSNNWIAQVGSIWEQLLEASKSTLPRLFLQVKVKLCQCVSMMNCCPLRAPFKKGNEISWPSICWIWPEAKRQVNLGDAVCREKALRTQNSTWNKGRESIRGEWIEKWRRTNLPFLEVVSIWVPTAIYKYVYIIHFLLNRVC